MIIEKDTYDVLIEFYPLTPSQESMKCSVIGISLEKAMESMKDLMDDKIKSVKVTKTPLYLVNVKNE